MVSPMKHDRSFERWIAVPVVVLMIAPLVVTYFVVFSFAVAIRATVVVCRDAAVNGWRAGPV